LSESNPYGAPDTHYPGVLPTLHKKHFIIRRNSIQKTTEKNLSVQNAWLRKEKTHAAAYILQICTLSEKKSA